MSDPLPSKSVSASKTEMTEIVMPNDLRSVLGQNLRFLLQNYTPGPWQSVQREFH